MRRQHKCNCHFRIDQFSESLFAVKKMCYNMPPNIKASSFIRGDINKPIVPLDSREKSSLPGSRTLHIRSSK